MTQDPTTTALTEPQLSIVESVELLTGYDEVAIEQHFGGAIEDLDGAKFVRAVLFGNLRRSEPDVKDEELYKRVMSMAQKQCSALFADPDPDADGDRTAEELGELPSSAEGKDDSAVD